MVKRRITLLGSTGSIGHSALDVIRRHPDRYEVVALCGHSRVDVLARQCAEFKPKVAVVATSEKAMELQSELAQTSPKTEVMAGDSGLIMAATLTEVDTVLAAIVGSAGLPSALAAVKAGKRILLANKETLVMAGAVFMQAAVTHGALILPVDSEHNAIFQSLPRGFTRGLYDEGVVRILLTASGGPFRTFRLDQIKNVTREQAIAHPNWSMGPKISVDSASMMNKGLELIEAKWLFGLEADRMEVVIHPQSIIHSMVEYADGSVISQMGNPDMRVPIAHALAYPDRISSGVPSLDLMKIGQLEFFPPDLQRFPCLELAYEAIRAGGGYSTVLNAANEICVDRFLSGAIGFMDIPTVNRKVCDVLGAHRGDSMEELIALDAEARQLAQALVRTCS